MQVLVPAGHEACDFIAVDKVGDEFTIFNTAIDDDFVEGRAAFTYIVDGFVSYFKWSHWEVAKFHSLV